MPSQHPQPILKQRRLGDSEINLSRPNETAAVPHFEGVDGSRPVLGKIIDGKKIADDLINDITTKVARLKSETGKMPGLAVVLVGEDPASAVYVRSKRKRAALAGMNSFEHRLPKETTRQEILKLIGELNADERVHGILVQLPLPNRSDESAVIDAIDPEKDVDGFHISNAGRLAVSNPRFVPCTPMGCMTLLKTAIGQNLSGLNAVVIGKSNIVGKPMAQLLMNADCTVTVAHIHTRDIVEICRKADILVVAAGSPGLVRGDWIKPGAVVIDVGINRVEFQGRPVIVGDVSFSEASHAGAITPVPGGVGPMTIACLLANTFDAFERQAKKSEINS